MDKCVPGKPEGGAPSRSSRDHLGEVSHFCSFPKRHMGHLGGYRGYSADVQTDALEEYWSADLEARLGKTLPALSRLSLDFVVFFASRLLYCFSRLKDGQHGRQHCAALQCTLACIRGSDSMFRKVVAKGKQNHIINSQSVAFRKDLVSKLI